MKPLPIPTNMTSDVKGLVEILMRFQQPRPLSQPVDPVHDRLPVQTLRDARIVTSNPFPTPALCQVLRDLTPCLLHDPPPSSAAQGPSALAESGSQIKAPAYVGISGEKRLELDLRE